jgi:hypothetical protein
VSLPEVELRAVQLLFVASEARGVDDHVTRSLGGQCDDEVGSATVGQGVDEVLLHLDQPLVSFGGHRVTGSVGGGDVRLCEPLRLAAATPGITQSVS